MMETTRERSRRGPTRDAGEGEDEDKDADRVILSERLKHLGVLLVSVTAGLIQN